MDWYWSTVELIKIVSFTLSGKFCLPLTNTSDPFVQFSGSKFNRLTVTEGAASKGALIEMLCEPEFKTKSINLPKTLDIEKNEIFSFKFSIKLGS